MKEAMNLEQSNDRRRALLQQRVEKQIITLEGIITELLAGVEMSELTSKDRLLTAARFITVYQSAISLDDALTENTTENRQSRAITSMLRNLKTDQVRDSFRIIDVEITPYPELEGDDQDDEQPYGMQEDV